MLVKCRRLKQRGGIRQSSDAPSMLETVALVIASGSCDYGMSMEDTDPVNEGR